MLVRADANIMRERERARVPVGSGGEEKVRETPAPARPLWRSLSASQRAQAHNIWDIQSTTFRTFKALKIAAGPS